MPKSLRNKIKHLAYKGELNERERDRILNALDREVKWIPIKDESELPTNDMLWVTHDNKYCCYVDILFWDMTEWSDDVSDVTAYMIYESPEPFQLPTMMCKED